MSGTPYPHESLTRVTAMSMMARRASGREASANSASASRGANRGSSGRIASPRPWKRTIRGGPAKAHSITTIRPFSRRCAMVSAPLPAMSR